MIVIVVTGTFAALGAWAGSFVAGIAFVVAARERGDDCGPWSWRHEIAHPIGQAPGQSRSELLISDALLTYQRHDDEQTTFHYRLSTYRT